MAARSTAVKWFTYQHQGAPTLTGAAGSILEILHACLVTGFGATPVDSITRDGSTVTVTISAGHGFVKHQVVRISGCDQQEYNGDFRIDTVTNDTFTFELPDGVTPATPATGTTLEAKAAPAGWERSFVSVDQLRAAFRSTAPEATGFYLYVDDTNAWTRRAGAKGYELMTDIDTRVNPFPYSETDDQWVWWYKSDDDATERPWALVADDRLFYLWVNYNSNDGQRIYAFGDFLKIYSNDETCCVVCGHGSATNNSYCGGLFTLTNPSRPPAGSYLARDALRFELGAPFSAMTVVIPDYDTDNTSSLFPACIGSFFFSYPTPLLGTKHLSRIYAVEYRTEPIIRAEYPGALNPLHDRPLADLTVDEDLGILALKCYASRWSYYNTESGPRLGQVFLDIIGPWR